MVNLRVGEQALLSFTLQDQLANWVNLSKVLGNKNLCVFFFTGTQDPNDVKECQLFARYYAEFQAAGCEVVGITNRPLPELASFSNRLELPFAVLSDPQLEAAAALKVRPTMGFFPKRVTYVFDQRGSVIMVYDSPASTDQHVARALDAASKTRTGFTPLPINSPYVTETEACCGFWTFLNNRMM